WLGRISLSVLKDYKDARGDARHHKKTFLLRYGAHKVALISTLSLCIGYAAFLYMVYPMGSSAWGLLLLIIAIGIFCCMRRPLFAPHASYFQLDGTFRTIAQSQLLLDVGVVLWLISLDLLYSILALFSSLSSYFSYPTCLYFGTKIVMK